MVIGLTCSVLFRSGVDWVVIGLKEMEGGERSSPDLSGETAYFR